MARTKKHNRMTTGSGMGPNRTDDTITAGPLNMPSREEEVKTKNSEIEVGDAETEEVKSEDEDVEVDDAEEEELEVEEEEPDDEVDEPEEEDELVDETDDDRAIMQLVRSIVSECSELPFDINATRCLKDVVKAYLPGLFHNANIYAQNAKRKTVRTEDLMHALHLRNPHMTHNYLPAIIAHYESL
ncbi:hypothetical protein AGABI2DRAFT_119176 [Agaricus bisporus var. bisporus H97]|uniref:hypothetical protein n=1 Tax=Agaricus bisporus var. bisporus (strain H97 / ATCC MYA-4626 / FGSC 10389) TaxID=936046 RepID=UPI00029F637C|nr:hypothetical protein AGABI2DRAFT_119176 [Agaricus bisporus var. bisporus H97]EKV45500.1 hypothetical protein AGABI2DRAFT_119176 [Agaricus bisporus var. bisporus H97]